MDIFHKVISTLEDGDIINVTIGLFFTAVTARSNGLVRCGLAATLSDPALEYSRLPVVKSAGLLEGFSARELAGWIFSDSVTEASVGLATINALLPPIHHPVELSAIDYILHLGAEQQVVMIGHFPFAERLKPQVKKLWVLELNPRDDDLPASAAPEVIPQADILAITATTLINHTFDEILRLRKPGARVLLLGPSTPLTAVLAEVGVNVLSGCIIDDPGSVVTQVRQAATFRQIHPHGVRLVTMELT
jgi:hypothetical protein